MGQELSVSECGNPDRFLLGLPEEEIDTTGVSTGLAGGLGGAYGSPGGVHGGHSADANLEQDYYSPLSTPTMVSAPRKDFASNPNNNTVIVFDWDDTLLCSSAINMQQWTMLQLRDLEAAAESILLTAMDLGETLIVTNGNATWVMDSAARFMPRLLPTLQRLSVVSARALFEGLYPGDPFMWKKAAFKHLLAQEGQVPAGMGLNLVALGDQLPEIDAARNVVRLVGGPSVVKTVKFQEAPSAHELAGQLGRAERELSKIVQEEHNVNRTLVKRALPQQLEHLVSQAPGWRFSMDEEEEKWNFPKTLAFKDLWPLFS